MLLRPSQLGVANPQPRVAAQNDVVEPAGDVQPRFAGHRAAYLRGDHYAISQA